MMMNSAPKNRADDDMAEKIDQGIMSATNNYTPTSLGQVSTAKPPSDPSSGTAKGAAAAAEGKSGSDSDEFEIPQRYTKNGRKRAVSFPLKLMKALSCKEHSDIIAWLPCGKKFKIIRPRAFKQEVLPRYFKEAKYSSFKRKLHRWGFERDGTLEQQQYSDDWFGSEVFSNPNFQKNNVELLEKMSCKKDVPAPPASASILSHLSQMQSKPGTAAASGIGYQLHVPAPNIPSAEGYKNVAAASAAAHAQLMANPTFQANQHQHQRFSPASSALRQTEATMESRVQEELIRRRVQGQLPQLAATMQLRPDETAETVQSRVAMSVEAEIERRTKERLESLSKSLGAPAPASALNEMQSAALSRQQQLSHQGGMNYPTQSQFDSLVAAQSFQSSSLSGSTPASNLDTLSQQRRVGNTSMLPAEAATLETRQRILALEKKISELQQLQRSTIEGSQTRGQQVSTTRPQVNTAGFIPQSLQQGFRGQQPQQQQQQQQQQHHQQQQQQHLLLHHHHPRRHLLPKHMMHHPCQQLHHYHQLSLLLQQLQRKRNGIRYNHHRMNHKQLQSK
mmetsp:Transcript_5246/g.7401  ORF Transcript_5246/g.7401 Transcript_5246/m.7401 type:complete len:563 (+) Transcript_5246:117-1805(+)